mmetsp:Transcript_6117/g.16957  ORF Transcript_6117/g.16957 Transcript_6117/m.16957 type:complete len:202 (-) Transcript_6117:591-1196(-)
MMSELEGKGQVKGVIGRDARGLPAKRAAAAEQASVERIAAATLYLREPRACEREEHLRHQLAVAYVQAFFLHGVDEGVRRGPGGDARPAEARRVGRIFVIRRRGELDGKAAARPLAGDELTRILGVPREAPSDARGTKRQVQHRPGMARVDDCVEFDALWQRPHDDLIDHIVADLPGITSVEWDERLTPSISLRARHVPLL